MNGETLCSLHVDQNLTMLIVEGIKCVFKALCSILYCRWLIVSESRNCSNE